MAWIGRNMFRCTRLFFLPFGELNDDIELFADLGGSREDYCKDNTSFIVANNWKEVEEHFGPYPGLLQYFLSEDVEVVNYAWLRMCLGAQCLIHPADYRVSPMEACRTEIYGSSEWGSPAIEHFKTQGELDAMTSRYERKCCEQIVELDLP